MEGLQDDGKGRYSMMEPGECTGEPSERLKRYLKREIKKELAAKDGNPLHSVREYQDQHQETDVPSATEVSRTRYQAARKTRTEAEGCSPAAMEDLSNIHK